MLQNQRIEIIDVHTVDYYFVVEGRLAIKCKKLNIYGEDRENPQDEEFTERVLMANTCLPQARAEELSSTH